MARGRACLSAYIDNTSNMAVEEPGYNPALRYGCYIAKIRAGNSRLLVLGFILEARES